MPVAKLKSFLDENEIKYLTLSHSVAYTAQEIAAKAHIPGRELAKTVIVKSGDDLAMAVLPASAQVDLDRLREAIGAPGLELATEDEFRGRFPDCELGAMPPFGNLYGMEVYVAGRLAEDDDIVFNAGSHTELLRMAYADFERLVQPRVLHFATVAV